MDVFSVFAVRSCLTWARLIHDTVGGNILKMKKTPPNPLQII